MRWLPDQSFENGGLQIGASRKENRKWLVVSFHFLMFLFPQNRKKIKLHLDDWFVGWDCTMTSIFCNPITNNS